MHGIWKQFGHTDVQAGGSLSDELFRCSVPPLRYFVAVRGKPKAPPRKGQGLWPAGILVGVTGFEPAASSSRTGDHSSLRCH